MADLNLRVSADPTELKKDIETMSTVTKKGASEMGGAVDALSFKQSALNKQYDIAAQKAATLATRHGETSHEALKAAAAAESLYLKLQQSAAASASTGQVINRTAGSFNGLQNSVNQITREMPAFTFSMQTGFMAISNNLPTFFDQISAIKAANKELAAAGQATKSVGSQVAASLLSWGTAMSLGITALTVLGPQLISYVGQLDEAKEATERLAVSTAQLAKEEQSIAKILADTSKLRLDSLRDGIDKERIIATQAYKDQITALEEAYLKQEITEMTYNMRRSYLKTIHQNKLSDIDKEAQDKRNKDAESSFNEQLAREKWVNDQLAKIRKKRPDLTGLKVGTAPTITKPTPIDPSQFVIFNKSEKPSAFIDFANGLKADAATLEETLFAMGKMAQAAAASAFQGVGVAIGESLAGDGDAMQKVAAVFGGMLSSLANQMGAAMIALGTPMLFTPITAGQGALYIAAGVGLVAAGSFIAAKMKSSNKGSGGGGGSSMSSQGSSGNDTGWQGTGFGNAFGSMGSMNMQPALVSRVSGRDIQLVTGRQGIYSRRLTGK
jgi:hypothetical protein